MIVRNLVEVNLATKGSREMAGMYIMLVKSQVLTVTTHYAE